MQNNELIGKKEINTSQLLIIHIVHQQYELYIILLYFLKIKVIHYFFFL